jgi:site-specific DNA recombinase
VPQLAEVRRRIDRLVDAIAYGLRTASTKSKLEELEARKAALERGLTDPPPAPLRLHPNLAALYREKVGKLHEALAAPETSTEAIGGLRALVERVVLHPVQDGFEIELVGAIANMVGVANETDA